jgi:hypothetical protein
MCRQLCGTLFGSFALFAVRSNAHSPRMGKISLMFLGVYW